MPTQQPILFWEEILILSRVRGLEFQEGKVIKGKGSHPRQPPVRKLGIDKAIGKSRLSSIGIGDYGSLAPGPEH